MEKGRDKAGLATGTGGRAGIVDGKAKALCGITGPGAIAPVKCVTVLSSGSFLRSDPA